jgi:hypothetical protein
MQTANATPSTPTANKRSTPARRKPRGEIDPGAVARLRKELGLISEDEWAAITGRTKRALKRDATLRRPPTRIRIGNKIFYRWRDCQQVIDDLARKRTAA